MKLSESTWTDIGELDGGLALLPVGSTEQHGPHAPLGTDCITATAVADAAARTVDDAIVAPTIPVGIAEEHRQFPGTLWVSPDTFRAYVRETVESLAFHGFDRVVVVNGHGGNVDALREICARVTRDGVAYAVPFTWFDAVGDRAESMGHGGPLETALVWHVRSDLVRQERLDRARDGAAEGWGDWVRGVNFAVDSDEFTENGVVGDPTAANPEIGRELLERASGALVDVMAALDERSGRKPADSDENLGR